MITARCTVLHVCCSFVAHQSLLRLNGPFLPHHWRELSGLQRTAATPLLPPPLPVLNEQGLLFAPDDSPYAAALCSRPAAAYAACARKAGADEKFWEDDIKPFNTAGDASEAKAGVTLRLPSAFAHRRCNGAQLCSTEGVPLEAGQGVDGSKAKSSEEVKEAKRSEKEDADQAAKAALATSFKEAQDARRTDGTCAWFVTACSVLRHVCRRCVCAHFVSCVYCRAPVQYARLVCAATLRPRRVRQQRRLVTLVTVNCAPCALGMCVLRFRPRGSVFAFA